MAQLIVGWVCAELSVGLIVTFELSGELPTLANLTSLWYIFSAYFQGSFILGAWILFVFSGRLEKGLRRLQLQPHQVQSGDEFEHMTVERRIEELEYIGMVRWAEHLRITLSQPYTALLTGKELL